MKEVSTRRIIDVVERLCIDSNIYLNDDIRESLTEAQRLEESESGKTVLKSLVRNAEIAAGRVWPYARILVWPLYLSEWVRM